MLQTKLDLTLPFFLSPESAQRFEKFTLEADAEAELAFKNNGRRNAKVVREIIGMILSRRILNLGHHGVLLICDERNNPSSAIEQDLVIVDVMVSRANCELQIRFEYGGDHVSH